MLKAAKALSLAYIIEDGGQLILNRCQNSPRDIGGIAWQMG
jgi:hypothetical protein